MLWPQEYEGLRAEAREVAARIRELYSAGASAMEAADPATRVASQRAMLAAFEVVSPDGVDETVGGVPCRVFRPASSRGTYLHFHGGAKIAGSPLMNDVPNAELSKRLGITVVSVDYRLAPEHPFPAGSDDCLAVAAAVLREEAGPVVIGGESAGAYYCALTLLRVRDELAATHRFRGANLVFGVYDLSGTPSHLGSRPSDVADVLDAAYLDFWLECYLPGRSRLEARDPRCSPLYADLSGLPPALFTVGSADHLLDDSLFMAARWQAWGNEAELAVYPDCIHGFTALPMELAKRAHDRIDGFLERCFAG